MQTSSPHISSTVAKPSNTNTNTKSTSTKQPHLPNNHRHTSRHADALYNPTNRTTTSPQRQTPSDRIIRTALNPLHVNPYRPHRRKQVRQRKFPLPSPSPPVPPPPTPPEPAPQQRPPPPTPTPPISNPYAKLSPTQEQQMAKVLAQYSTDVSSQTSDRSSKDDSSSEQNRIRLDDISVQRTKSRLVYRPERLHYTDRGTLSNDKTLPTLPGLSHLPSAARATATKEMEEILSIHSELQACMQESDRLHKVLQLSMS